MRFSDEIQDSPTLALAELAKKKASSGLKILSLAVGEPDFNTPNFIIEATKKALDEGHTTYSTPQGILPLREAIAKDYQKRYGANYTANEIIIFPGAKDAIFAALASILDKNDEVIILSPYYVSYPPIIKLAETTAKIKIISLKSDFSLPLEKIRKAITPKTKCLILNYPHNPTGKLLTPEEIRQIVKLVDQYKIYLLSDEIYEKLILKDHIFESFAQFPQIKDRLILINGFSKSYAMTGFRLGYALGPVDIIKRMNLINQNTHTNTNTFIQYGALSIFTHQDEHLPPYLEELKKRVDFVHKEVRKNPLFQGHKPEGAFYFFLNIQKTGLDSTAFAHLLLEKYHLVVTPGIAFGKKYDHYVRLSLATSFENLEKALKIFQLVTI